MTASATDLGPCRDVFAVSVALLRVCARYGDVEQLQILTASHQGQLQALCFFRLTRPDAEEPLMLALGAQRCDGRLAVVVNLKPALKPIRFRRNPPRAQPVAQCHTLTANAPGLAWPLLNPGV